MIQRDDLIRRYDKLYNIYLNEKNLRELKKYEPLKYLLLQQNRKYFNLHRGERCFVLGNGPSLKQIDLLKLKNEYTFTVNEMFRHSQYEEMNSNYHVIADPYYINLHTNNPVERDIISLILQKGSVGDSPEFFFPLDGYDFIKKNRIDRKVKCNFICPKMLFYRDYDKRIDFSETIPSLWSVVQYAILLAIYMGFTEINLLGCDATNVLTDLEAFHGGAWGEKYVYEVSKETEDAQKKVFANQGVNAILNGYSHIFEGYYEINKYCIRNHVKLYNCSADTLIDSIPRRKFGNVI